MTRLRAYLSSLVAFKDVNDASTVTMMKRIERPRARRVDSQYVAALQPASAAGRDLTLEWWLRTYAPDHRKEVA